MAETAQEKTEQPTSRQLSRARKEGQVPMSQEMMSAVMLVALTALVALLGARLANWAMVEMSESFRLRHDVLSDSEVFHKYIVQKSMAAFWISLPYLAVVFVISTVTNFAISGKTFNTAQVLKLKFDIINPMAGFKAMFSKKALIKLGLSIVKILFIGTIAYYFMREKILEMAGMQWAWDMGILAGISGLILQLMIRVCLGVVIIGIIDLVYQKWKYIEDLKMTKQQVKDEQKDSDGPPEVKKKIRQKQFEAGLRRMMQAVPDANVVLVNPTHYAVALKYDPETMASPIVVAKGKDHICEKIKDTARAYGVPIIRRPSLTRNLYASTEVNQAIPEKLYIAVAEVLALIHRLRHTGVGR